MHYVDRPIQLKARAYDTCLAGDTRGWAIEQGGGSRPTSATTVTVLGDVVDHGRPKFTVNS